jgi:hypothetical protein
MPLSSHSAGVGTVCISPSRPKPIENISPSRRLNPA